MPKTLSPVAKKLWKKVTDEHSHLTTADSELLAAYVESWAMLQLAQNALREHGLILSEPIVNRSTGNVTGHKRMKNPAHGIAKDERAAMQSLSTKLGLDPSSRERLGVDITQRKSASPAHLPRMEYRDNDPLFLVTADEAEFAAKWEAMTPEEQDAHIANS
jgi:P27 family predicted phage terminase small subunit